MIKEIYKGESVSFLLTFEQTYDMARIQSHYIYVGNVHFIGEISGHTISLQLKSNDTNELYGLMKVVLWIEDSLLGVRKPFLFDLNVVRTKAEPSNVSTSEINDVIVPIVISETEITVDDVLYNYVKGDAFTFADFTPEQITELQAPALEAKEIVLETNENITIAEGLRVTAEQGRVTSEGLRVTAENGRVTVEGNRVTAEQGRVTAENSRVSAESTRGSNETTRISNENTRISQETARVNAEAARVASGAELKTNMSTNIETDKASTTKYPQLKALYDWATGRFLTTTQTVAQTIGATGARLQKLWATDIESTNMPTVGGVSLSTTFAAKSSVTDYMALYQRKIATVVNGVITAIQDTIDAYNSRVTADSGALNDSAFVKKYYDFCYDNQMFDSIKFAWLGAGGSKFRTSGIYSYFTKIYSMLGGYDAAQATSTNQPYLSGNIAPNEKYCLKNPNGGSNFMTHNAISFGASEAWSVMLFFNFNGDAGANSNILGTSNSVIATKISTNRLRFRNESGTTDIATTNFINNLIGKNTVLRIIAENNSIKYYVNGLLFENVAANTDFNFSNILFSRSSYFSGKMFGYIVNSQILTPEKILSEYNLLCSYIPEIESVVIGTKTVATSNLEVVCNAAGTLIPDGTVTGTWVAGTAFWCHHTDIVTGAVFGKLYNKAGRNVIITSPPAGWHVATEAENTTLAALGGLTLKMSSTSWWVTNNGTNTTGFTALGGGKRNADGSFSTKKEDAYFWCADSDKVLHITDAGVATIEAVTSVNDGYSIRLVKN